MNTLYQFDQYTLDMRKRALFRRGSPVPLTPKAFDLLLYFAQNPDRVITKDELLKAVWADSFVEEGNLTQTVFLLRKALGQKSEGSGLIVTIPRKGYQFTGEISIVSQVSQSSIGSRAGDLAGTAVSSVHIAPEKASGEKSGDVGTSLSSELATPLPTPSAAKSRRSVGALLGTAAIILVAIGYLSWERFRTSPPAPSNRIMLAVLPLQNLTGDPEQEYFADGLTEELIAQLSQLHPEQLGVIARTSVMGYKHSDKRLDQIGRELSVQYVLESSFRRSADRLRLTIQLVRVKDDAHLWAENYDRQMSDILAVQDDVASAVAREIQLHLTLQQQAELTQHRTIDPAAHESYLKGRYFWNKRTEVGFRKAVEYFQLAIAKDPAHAQAYAGLADSYLLLSGYGFEPQAEALPKAKAAATKAIAIDNRLAEAHTTLAMISLQHEWDWPESEKHFKRALDLNPNYSVAHEMYGDGYLWSVGKTEEAIAELRKAHELDPLSLIIVTDLAKHLSFAGHYSEGMEQFRKVLEAEPDFIQAHYYLSRTYVLQGSYADAIAETEKIKPPDVMPFAVGQRGYVYALQGKRHEALEVVKQLQQAATTRHIDPQYIADIYIALGDKDLAFTWLNKAYEDHSPIIIMLNTDPKYNPIRSDPRFADLVRRVRIPR
jgi:TolB-like protein/DNA-binding winged helix-turn-helix (wHTH) protein